MNNVHISQEAVASMATEQELLEAAEAHKQNFDALDARRRELEAELTELKRQMAGVSAQYHTCKMAAREVAVERVNAATDYVNRTYGQFGQVSSQKQTHLHGHVIIIGEIGG